MSRIVFFDLETGGLQDHHPDIQIAAIAVDQEFRELETFEAKIQFAEQDADPDALELNSYDHEVWGREARALRVVVDGFAAFLRRHATIEMTSRAGNPFRVARLAGHNAASFDGPRLQRMFRRDAVFLPASYQVLDTLQLALWRPPVGQAFSRFRLEDLCRELGIPNPDAHDALADVRSCVAVARLLMEKP